MTEAVLGFARAHADWLVVVVALLAFAESLVVVSLIVPATAILLALGGMIGAGGIAFWPVWGAAAAGAALGDWLSFWLGSHYRREIAGMWPLSRHPELLVRGANFFYRWGIAGVFLGRFFGPLRAVVPFVAGAAAMPPLAFQLANAASALVWATGILAPGFLAFTWW